MKNIALLETSHGNDMTEWVIFGTLSLAQFVARMVSEDVNIDEIQLEETLVEREEKELVCTFSLKC